MVQVGLGSNQVSSEQQSGPWLPWQKPAQDIYGQAEELFDPANLPEYFPGSTVAGFSPMQTQANQRLFNQAMGSRVAPTASSYFQSVLGGPQMNPYIDKMADRISRQYQETVQPRIDSMFRGANAGGGSAHALATGRAGMSLGDSLANLYSRSYESDQARKMQALGMTPTIQQAEFAPFFAARDAGQYGQDQQQREIDAAVARHNYESGGGAADWLTQYVNAILGHPVQVASGKSEGSNLRSSFGY